MNVTEKNVFNLDLKTLRDGKLRTVAGSK